MKNLGKTIDEGWENVRKSEAGQKIAQGWGTVVDGVDKAAKAATKAVIGGTAVEKTIEENFEGEAAKEQTNAEAMAHDRVSKVMDSVLEMAVGPQANQPAQAPPAEGSGAAEPAKETPAQQ